MSKKFSKEEVIDLICNCEVERIEDGEGRWSKYMLSIVEGEDDKFYSLYWEKGLTECQDNYFEAQEAEEVEKRTFEKTITVTEWVKVKNS